MGLCPKLTFRGSLSGIPLGWSVPKLAFYDQPLFLSLSRLLLVVTPCHIFLFEANHTPSDTSGLLFPWLFGSGTVSPGNSGPFAHNFFELGNTGQLRRFLLTTSLSWATPGNSCPFCSQLLWVGQHRATQALLLFFFFFFLTSFFSSPFFRTLSFFSSFFFFFFSFFAPSSTEFEVS